MSKRIKKVISLVLIFMIAICQFLQRDFNRQLQTLQVICIIAHLTIRVRRRLRASTIPIRGLSRFCLTQLMALM